MSDSSAREDTKQQVQNQNDAAIADRINVVVVYFHDLVLGHFIPITLVKTFVLLILLVLGYTVARAAAISGFSEKTVQKKKKMFENGLFSKLFARKVGVGRKSKTACVYQNY